MGAVGSSVWLTLERVNAAEVAYEEAPNHILELGRKLGKGRESGASVVGLEALVC